MIVVGIDPGISGGISVLDGDAATVHDTPTSVRKVGTKLKRRVDPVALARLLGLEINVLDPTTEAVVFVERAGASPHMGVSSAFAYGECFGLVVGILAHLGVPTRLVTAVTWKRAMGLVTKGSRELGRNEARDKSPALELARKLYPKLADKLALAKHDGRAEALLLAHYGAELLDEEAAEKAGPLFVAKRRAPALVQPMDF